MVISSIEIFKFLLTEFRSNILFFLDILRHSREETVSLGFSDAYNPGIIADGEMNIEPEKLPSPLFVLMPMRLNEEAVVA